ncbi:MAG: flagellar FliJ family protein [Alphaproteobacteria bacterium]
MKSLGLLIKLQKTKVDEQRQHLSKLQTRLEEIELQIQALEASKITEQRAAEEYIEARGTYGAFLKAAIEKGRLLENDRIAAEVAVEAARDVLTQLFEEQKRYETAEAARIAAEEKEERRRETIEMDEIGGITHERKKAD